MRIAFASRCPRDLCLGIVCLFSCLGLLVPTIASAATGAHFWSQRFGDASTQRGYGVATDASGNVYLAGHFYGTVNFGGSNMTATNTDIYLAKFNASGVHQWSQHFLGPTGDQFAQTLVTDASGNVYLAGHFTGTVNFGGSNLTSPGGNADIYMAKFNASGVHQWSQHYGVDGTIKQVSAVTTDTSGNVYLAGYFHGTVNFGGSNLSAGGQDIYLAKFNASGVHQWSQRFGDASTQYGGGVATDGSGNVYLSGSFQGTVNFGGSNLTSAGDFDIYLAKFNASGVHQWSQRFGDANAQASLAVAADGAGNTYLSSYFRGTVNFGGSTLTSAGAGVDIALAKFNASGVHQWSQHFGDASDQYPLGVVLDGSGSVYLTGPFWGSVNFGGSNLTSAGVEDIFLAKFNVSGVHQWSQRFGDASVQYPTALAAGPSGDAYLAGFFQGTVNFGGSNLTSAGGEDAYLAKFVEGEPVIAGIVDVGNDQGRSVRIQVTPSRVDAPGAFLPIAQYELFRRIDPLPSVAPGVVLDATDAPARASMKSIAMFPPGAWDFVGLIPAHAEETYFTVTATLADSTISAGQHYSVFFTRAATGTPTVFYDSPLDSGYSLDNLAPSVPNNFAYSSGNLTWDESAAADFDYFSVYGSNTNSFASATLVDYTVAPAMDVSGSPYTFYFVTATDFSGNEGNPAALNTATGVGDGPKRHVLSVSAYPNPFNPRTTIRYTLPSSGRVTISIYDARGVRVSTLLDGEKPAGAYTTPWDGRSGAGTIVSSGVYFARIQFGDETRAYKMLLLK